MVISQFNTSYGEDFNSLASSGTSSALPTGWALIESGTAADSNYVADNGGGNAGNTYSYGSTGSSDRALGSLQSGSLASSFGTVLTNSTGSTLTELTISFTGEQWRLGLVGRADRLEFAFSTNASSLGNGAWTANTNLNFSSPVLSGNVGSLDGNLAANRTFVSYTLTGLSIANGSSLWIRWSDFNVIDVDDGLAIDDFSVSASRTVVGTVPDQLPIGVVIFAFVGLFLCHRRLMRG